MRIIHSLYQYKSIKYSIYIAVFSLFVFGLIYSAISFNYQSIDSDESLRESMLIEPAPFKSKLNNSAFAFLALGAQAHQMNCNAAVESLVKIAGWDGPIYILTDKKKCFDKSKLISDSGMKAENLHIIETKEDFDSGGLDLMHPSIGARKNRVKSFAMKTRLFEYINDPTIDIIAYADCDIIFGLHGCAKDFISAGPKWGETRHAIKFSHLYKDNDNKFVGMHCGSFVAHRKYSKEIMKIWKDEIEKFIDGDDNDAYMTAYYRIQNEIDKLRNTTRNNTIQRNPLEPFELTCVGCSDEYERFVHPLEDPNKNIHCLNHISKARCKSYGRENIQNYVNRFQLLTYDNTYNYCMSPWIQPLSYGWFPLSYLSWGNSCIKLEKYF